ncbi:MAG TPA: PAS domain S-box protein [Gaiellaceae bacterium]|nr:PAS domain S-box protein [Gaiellaceae bacterium]
MTDVSEEQRLKAATRRPQALAELGQRALAGLPVPELMDEAVGVVAAGLGVELVEIQELLPDGDSLLLRAGLGWNAGVVGHATLAASRRSQAGYTLLCGEPVVVADMRTESRFDGSGLWQDYGVVSSASVVIAGAERPYGVLAGHTATARAFEPEDVHFLQALAHVLAGAIRRADHERRLAESEERLRLALEAGDMGVWDWNLRTDELVWSEKVAEINRSRDGAFDGTFDSFLAVVAPEDRERVSAAISASMEEGSVYDVEFRLRTVDGSVRWNASRGRVLFDERGLPTRMIGVAADITARKQAEEELRTSRELYRLVVENAKDLITLLGPEGRIVYASPSWEAALGFSPAELTAEVNPLEVHPEDAELARATIASAVQSGATPVTQARVRAKDGTWVTVEGVVVPIYDEEGRPVLLLTTSRDVTERRRAEEALRAAEQRYRTLVEQLPLVTYMDALDGAGPNLYTSPQIDPLLGYAAADWSNDSELFSQRLHPEDRDRVLAERAHARATGEPLRTEYRILARDGRPVWLQEEAIVVRDEADRPLFLQGYLLDISERKRAEQAVQESEERFRTIFESSPIGIGVGDEEGRVVASNPAFAAMLGFAPSELSGRAFRDFTVSEDVEPTAGLYASLMAGEGEGFQAEKRYVHRDGRSISVRLTISRVAGGDDERRLALVIAEDITERKRLEEQLFRSQKLEAVGRLAGGVAHDFNNLLTGILGYADLLRMGLAEDDPRRGDAEEVKRAAERAADLTRQLLAFSRRQVLQPRVLDLNRIVEDMERMLRRLIGEDIELVTSVEPDLGRVEADPGQLEQVVANLVVNARDAMPGGGRLVLETANAAVDETLASGRTVEMPPGPYVVLTVSDTGAGMDEETQAHAFEPFFTTKEVGKGTGLGLATVYGIVKQSGGFIWVYSEPGEGTTFKIYLPRVEKPADGTADPPSRPARGGSETVLVVEDEKVVRDLIGRDLTGRGYAVLTAGTGVEALAVAAAHEGAIDLVVTDVVMPEMGGLELTQRLAAERPGIKVVYMSGYTELALAGEVASRPLLQKPFNASMLADTIREVLDVAPAA